MKRRNRPVAFTRNAICRVVKKGLTLSDLFVVIAIVGMKRAVLARTRPTVAGKKASLGAHKPAVFFDLNHPDVWLVAIFSCQGLVCAWPQLFF